MAREATKAQKRLKESAKDRKAQAILAAHCRHLGIPIPTEKVERDEAGNRIGYVDYNPDKASTMRTKQLLRSLGFEIKDIPGEERFMHTISEEKHREIIEKPQREHAKKAGNPGTEEPMGKGLKHIKAAIEESTVGSLSEALGVSPPA